MHSKSSNKEILTNDKADKVIEEFFASLLSRHQNCLKDLMRGSDFFSLSTLIYCITNVTKRSESDIDSPIWIKSKKTQQILLIKMTINVYNPLQHSN